MRKLVDKINGLEIIKVHKPDGEVVAYQVEDRKAKLNTVVARFPFLKMAREKAEELTDGNN